MAPAPSGKLEGRRRVMPVAALLLCAAVTAALGMWQVHRLAWKQGLIAHVAAVSHAAPVDAARLPFAPAPATLKDLEYRKVLLAGQFEPQATALVTALTDLGGGYWEMVPLRLADGRALWVNRGFVQQGTQRLAAAAAVPAGPVVLTGLLRQSEPGGGFLRPNVPAAEAWHSRDIAALSTARHLQGAAIWFVDAAATPPMPGQPVGGLTVLTFPNNHLQYALTWFALCAMSLFAIRLVLRARP